VPQWLPSDWIACLECEKTWFNWFASISQIAVAGQDQLRSGGVDHIHPNKIAYI
jgi:hypothetical protein